MKASPNDIATFTTWLERMACFGSGQSREEADACALVFESAGQSQDRRVGTGMRLRFRSRSRSYRSSSANLAARKELLLREVREDRRRVHFLDEQDRRGTEAMTDQEWKNMLGTLTKNNVDTRIRELKDRISDAQRQLTIMCILRSALVRVDEIHAINNKKANEAVDEALRQVNEGVPGPWRVATNGEGGIHP